MSSFGNRLKEFRKSTGLNQTEFGKKIQSNQQSVSQWEKGDHIPFGDTLINIQKAFPNLNTDWLIHGKGNMIKTGSSEERTEEEYRKENKELEEKVKQLEARVQMLTDKLLKANEEYLEILKKQNK